MCRWARNWRWIWATLSTPIPAAAATIRLRSMPCCRPTASPSQASIRTMFLHWAANTATSTAGSDTSQLPYDVLLSTRYGQVDYKDPWLVGSSGKSREAYREWEAKVSKEMLRLTWSLAYADTDISRRECMNLNGFDDVCSARSEEHTSE